jgi:transcriptional regulator with XRE-family HTH domain
MALPGRNEPCPCGSGKKFKKCCIDTYQVQPETTGPLTIEELRLIADRDMEWENELYRLQAQHFLAHVDQSYGIDAIYETLQLWLDFTSTDEPLMKKFGAFSAALEYFTATNEGARVTQTELAERYGVSSATVSKRYNEIMDFAEFAMGFAGYDEDDEDDEGIETPRMRPEKMFREIERLLAEQQLETIEEAQAFVDDYLSSQKLGLPAAPRSSKANSPRDQAQDLLYEAMDEPSSSKRVHLAKEALRIHPDSPDAYSILGEESSDVEEAKAWFLRAAEAGERDLGKAFFEENEGHFGACMKPGRICGPNIAMQSYAGTPET